MVVPIQRDTSELRARMNRYQDFIGREVFISFEWEAERLSVMAVLIIWGVLDEVNDGGLRVTIQEYPNEPLRIALIGLQKRHVIETDYPASRNIFIRSEFIESVTLVSRDGASTAKNTGRPGSHSH